MKRLFFYLYEQEDIETNIAFKVHEIMLKKYLHVFDELNFVVAVNDVENGGLRARLWISNICGDRPFSVRIVDNVKIRESRIVKEDLFPMIESGCEDEIFYAHSKGITDVNMEIRDKGSVLRWLIAMYYYSLEHIDDVTEKLKDHGMYGSLLTYFQFGKLNDTNEDTHRCFYVGNFYWLKPSNLKGKLNEKVYESLKDSRFLAENFPMCYPLEELSSYRDATTNSIEADLYYMKAHQWLPYLERYGNAKEVFELQNSVIMESIYPGGAIISKD